MGKQLLTFDRSVTMDFLNNQSRRISSFSSMSYKFNMHIIRKMKPAIIYGYIILILIVKISAGSRGGGGGGVGPGPRASHQEGASHQFAAGALFNVTPPIRWRECSLVDARTNTAHHCSLGEVYNRD